MHTIYQMEEHCIVNTFVWVLFFLYVLNKFRRGKESIAKGADEFFYMRVQL